MGSRRDGKRMRYFSDFSREVGNSLKLELAPESPVGLVRMQTGGPRAQSFCPEPWGDVTEKSPMFVLHQSTL